MIEIVEIKNPFEKEKAIFRVDYLSKPLKYYADLLNKDVYINGNKIVDIENTYPADNDQIIIMPHIAGGGFKKILGFVAQIALMAYAGNVAGGLWGGAFAKGTVGAFLASGAVMYVGGRLINTVFPQQIATPTYDNSLSSPTYGWDLPSVFTSEGGIIGETYGECIPRPQLLEQHVETVGDSQYLNLLYCGGYGPVDSISDIRIDNTDISNFSNVQLETRLGTNEQEPISFFNGTPLDQSIGLELETNKPIIRTTDSVKANAIEVTLEWPSGLFHLNDDGGYDSASIDFTIKYRKTGTSEWLGNKQIICHGGINEISIYPKSPSETWTINYVKSVKIYGGIPTGIKKKHFEVIGSVSGKKEDAYLNIPYDNGIIKFMPISEGSSSIIVDNGIYSVTSAQSTAIRKSYKIGGLDEGQYDVKVTVINKPSGSRYSSLTQWSILTAYNSGLYSRPNKVLVAMRILATNQLSGGTPSVTWRQIRKGVYVYNPCNELYEIKSARNPIWAAYDILHGCKYLKNINTGQYEYVIEGSPVECLNKYYDQWVMAANYADEQIKNQYEEFENRFEFDAHYDTEQKRITAAQKAASVGHAIIIPRGRNYGITIDRPGEICQVFGEGRTVMSSLSGTFMSKEERAKAVEITYNDSDNNFKNTIFMMRLPEYNNEVTVQDNPAQLTLFGVSRRSQAYREGMYTLAANERQLQFIDLKTDVDSMVAEYGDIVGLNHAVSQIGVCSGRVVGATSTNVILDKDVEMDDKIQYEIIIQLQTDEIIKRTVIPTPEITNLLTVSAPFDEGKMPQSYDNYAFGEVKKAIKPFRIVSVGRSNDLMVNLKLAEYDEALYASELNYDKYPIIDYTPKNSGANIESVSLAEENYLDVTGTLVSSIYVSWKLKRGQRADYFSVFFAVNGVDYTLLTNTPEMKCVVPNIKTKATYSVKIVPYIDGVPGSFGTGEIYVTGKDTPPSDVSSLTLIQDDTKIIAIISEVLDKDINRYQLRLGTRWESSILVGEFIGSKYIFDAQSEGTVTYLIKAIDNSGNYSKNAGRAIVSVVDLPVRNIIYERTEDMSTWAIKDMWKDLDGGYRIRACKRLGDYAHFADIFGRKLLLVDSSEIVFPIIDLGPNILDESCYYVGPDGTLKIHNKEKLGDYAHFADIFGAVLTPKTPEYVKETFVGVTVDYKIIGSAYVDIQYRASLDGNNWSDLKPLSQKQFIGRYAEIHLFPHSADGSGQIVISGAAVSIDVPDIEDVIESKDIPAARTRIYYHKKFSAVKSIAPYTQDGTGMQATCWIVEQTTEYFDIEILNASGTMIAGKLQKAVIRGY